MSKPEEPKVDPKIDFYKRSIPCTYILWSNLLGYNKPHDDKKGYKTLNVGMEADEMYQVLLEMGRKKGTDIKVPGN